MKQTAQYCYCAVYMGQDLLSEGGAHSQCIAAVCGKGEGIG